MDEDQRQQAQREQSQLEISKASQQKEQVVWDLENQLDKWVNKCALCYVQQQMGQQVDVQHTLDQCGNALQKEVVQEIRGLERIRFEPYASCYACGVPQKICMQWGERANGQGRFGRASGGRCQYQGVVRTSIAAMMIAGPDEVVDEQVYSWMKAKGIEQVKQMMIKWFGQRVIWGEVEGSILIQVFYKLVVGLEQWRRDSKSKGSGRVAEWQRRVDEGRVAEEWQWQRSGRVAEEWQNGRGVVEWQRSGRVVEEGRGGQRSGRVAEEWQWSGSGSSSSGSRSGNGSLSNGSGNSSGKRRDGR